MRKFIIALAALLTVAPAAASSSGPVEKFVTYYSDDSYGQKVGDATFYCDGTIITNGMVTASQVEIYYGCP
jgi:hypothetical protein